MSSGTTQRVIEFLLKFSQEGEELLAQVPETLDKVAVAAADATAAFNKTAEIGASSSQALNTQAEKAAATISKVEVAAADANVAVKQMLNAPGGNLAADLEKTAVAANDEATALLEAAKALEIHSQAKAAAKQQPADDSETPDSGLADGLSDIKGLFGRGSTFTAATKLLAGAGPIIGLHIALTQFDQLATGIKNVADQERNGELANGEWGTEMGKQIPLVGKLISGVLSLNEAIFGQKAAADAAAKSLKDLDDQHKKMDEDTAKFVQDAKSADASSQAIQDAADKLSRQARHVGEPDGLHKQIDDAFDARTDRDEAAATTRSAAIKQSGGDQIGTLQRQIDDLNTRIAKAEGPGLNGGKQSGLRYQRDDLQKQLDAAKQAVGEIDTAYANQLNASDQLFTAQANSARVAAAQKQMAVYVDGVKKDWASVVSVVSQAKNLFDNAVDKHLEAMAEAGKKLTEQVQLPTEKYNAGVHQVNEELSFDDITPETAKRALEQLKTQYGQDIAAKQQAETQKVLASDEASVKITQGYQQMVAQNKLAYDTDLLNWQTRVAEGQITPDQFRAVQQELIQQQTDADAKALAQMQIQHDQYLAQAKVGVDRSIADAQVAYEQDVANYQDALKQKTISQSEFDTLVAGAQKRQQQAVRDAGTQKKNAGDQVDLLVDNSQGRPNDAKLKQIQIDADAQKQGFEKQRDEGLIDEQQYQDALAAIDKSSSDKRLAINGTFFDGMTLEFKKLAADAPTLAEIGATAADDLANGFGNAFNDIITGSKSAGDAFRSFAASVLGDIAKLIAQSAIKNLLGGIFGGSGGGGGGIGGSLVVHRS